MPDKARSSGDGKRQAKFRSGATMEVGGISRRLIDFCDSLVGWAPGGLAAACIVASMIIAGISGSAAADTAAIGMLTPPVWICLFVNCGIANVSSGKISRAVIPLVGVAFLDLLIACLWSPLTIWLPTLLYR